VSETNICVEDIGEGIAEAEILDWFVKPGDKVAQFDKICVVQTDKSSAEITSRYDGVITSLGWKEGELAKIGSTLCTFEVADSSVRRSKPEPKESFEEETASRPAKVVEKLGSFSIDPVLVPPQSELMPLAGYISNQDDRVLATPSVRRLAKDHALELSRVPKSGKDGRLTKSDVLAYLASVPLEERQKQIQPSAADSLQLVDMPREANNENVSNLHEALTEDLVVPVKGIQRIMVKSMTESLKIPHFQFKDEIEMNQVAELRQQLKVEAEHQGLKLSYMPLLIKACSLALVQYPMLNAHISSDATEIVYKMDHNISVAMDTPRGLLVPVIHQVQKKSIFEIARELTRLQQLGNDNKLGQTELSGATFTLSNIGSIGGTYASPVIPAPTVVIGAIGKIQTLPRFKDEADYEKGVYPAKLMNVSWAADHRVVDGATMARFSNLMKRYIEVPQSMFASMV